VRSIVARPTTDPVAFYRTTVTNHYARALHAATVDGRAYGFAFDDVAGFASCIQDSAPTGIGLTLTPFQAAARPRRWSAASEMRK
jgi:hypothetical protein